MPPTVPTLRYERSLWRDGLERVVGVDEVGVAPTCGAVVAAAVILVVTIAQRARKASATQRA